MMTTTLHITTHAVCRYIERIEDCSPDEAMDRIGHAVSISVPASARHKRRHWRQPKGTTFRYCPVESLLLVMRPLKDAMKVVTVFRVDAKDA